MTAEPNPLDHMWKHGQHSLLSHGALLWKSSRYVERAGDSEYPMGLTEAVLAVHGANRGELVSFYGLKGKHFFG